MHFTKTTTFLFSFLVFSIFCMESVFAGDFTITINNEKHALVAQAGGCEYQWFKNGQVLEGATDRFLPIAESGTYEVKITKETGSVSTPSVTVAVNAVGAIIKIYTIGDSTVQDYVAGYYPRKGWGQVLPSFFNAANVQVINKAVGGTSSMSFYNNHWTAVKNALVAGDFVFIQFGINDRNNADPARYSPTGGVFEGYLTKFVNETKAKGAFPILVTTVRRNAWNANGTVYDAYHDHPVATRNLAKTLNVPLIDLDAKLKVDMEAAGQLYCTRFWSNTYVAGEYSNYPNGNTDPVHFQEMGAIHNASLVVQGIKELAADVNVSKLIPFLKPQYQTSITVNPLGSDDATTLTASYPQGLTITLKTIPKTGKTFQKWNNAANTSLSTATLTTVTSGNAATSYAAMYQGATACTATATAGGSTSICQGSSVELTASNGTSYIWKNGVAQVGSSQTYSANTPGSYTVEVTNASSCKATSTAIVVTVTTPTIWYADADEDGKGDPNTTISACIQPTGYVTDKTDFCPLDPNKTAAGNCGCGKTEESCMDCNGTVNGTAIKDNCDRCVEGSTGKIACSVVGEAETEACAFDGITETINSGFKGTSYVNVPNEVNASITFHLLAQKAGNAIISFRYANGSTNDRPAQIVVNGNSLPNPLNFPPTSAFTTWKTVETTLALMAGSNLVKLLASTVEGLANIDQIGYVTTGLSTGNCMVTALTDFFSFQKLQVYPNPFEASVMILCPADFDYTVYDLSGKNVENGHGSQQIEIAHSLQTGVYCLKLQIASEIRYMKLSKK